MENFVNLLTQITAGAFTGYITNTYAINMLFKEYKIFNSIKIGGVIIRTKDDFIDRISKLVERDIINYKTLGRELHKSEFENTIENFVKDFFNDALAVRLNILKIKDLKGSRESLAETEKFLLKIINSNIEDAKEVVFRNISMSDLVSPSQRSCIINNLIEKVLERINENDSITTFSRAFIREKGHLTLAEIFQPSKELFENEINKIQQETPELVREIIASIDDDTLIRTFQYQLNKKRLGEIILPSARDNTFEKLKENIQDFLLSNDGNLLINNLSEEIINLLRKTDKPIIQLLTPDFQREAESYLEKILPYFSSRIALWLRESSLEIEVLIQEGIDETVENVQGMRGMVLSMVKESLLSNIASGNNIAELIVDFIENKVDLKQVSEGITEEILIFLNKKNIKDIVISLENNGFLSAELVSIQLRKAFSLLVNSIDPENTNKMFDKTIGEVYSADLKKDLFLQGISQTFNSKIANIMQIPLENLIKEKNISNLTIENLELINSFSASKISLQGITLGMQKMDLKEIGEKNLGLLLEKFNKIPEIHNKITRELLNQLHINLPQALDGKIENLVAENLNKLTPEEVSNVVHDFMGRELGPITKFGAILGGGAGLLLALSGSGTNITSLTINPISLLIYGGVGVLTNVVALEMIFRPYKEQKFLNKIGLSNFSQGYIMKNKKSFGQNMGKFVEESLLERRMIRSRFCDLKPELTQDIKRAVYADDFAIIEKFISKNEEQIQMQLSKIFSEAVLENKEKLGNFVANRVAERRIEDFTGNDNSSITEFFAKVAKERFIEALSSRRSFASLVSPQTKEKFKKILSEKVENYIENLDSNSLEQAILTNENEIKFKQFTKQPLSEWLKNEKIESIIFNPETISAVSKFIKIRLEAPLNSQQTIGSVFQGTLRGYIETNFPIIKIEKLILEMLNNNSQEIISKIQKDIYENLGFLQKGGYSLMGGDQLIEEVVQYIISAKIPPYLNNSTKEIEKILRNTLEENVYTIKLKDIQKILREKQLNNFVENLLSSEETKKSVLKIFENLVNVPLEQYLKVADLDSLTKIYKIFQDEIKLLVKETLNELALWKKDISLKASKHIIKNIDKSFGELSPEKIFSKNPHFYNLLEKDTQTGAEFINFLISFWEEDLRKETSGNILSPSILAKDLSHIFENLSDNEEVKEYLGYLIKKIITELKENRINFLHTETKKDITEQIVLAGLESLERNLPDILSVVDFKAITEDEIDKMEGKEIHILFKSFAGKYFTRLKLWGVIGALFGLHGGVSVLATLGYLIKKGEKNE